MQTFGEGLFNQTATPRAVLGRVVGINLDHCLTSILGFVRQHRKEVAPSRVTHALGDVAAAQATQVQLLEGDKPEASDQFSRNLMMKVAALVGNVFVPATYLARQFAILATASLATSAEALQDRQLFFRCTEPARVVDLFTRRQGGKGRQAHINANIGAHDVGRFRVGQLKLEAGVPVAKLVPLEDDHLDLGVVWKSAVLKDAQQTNMLDVESIRLEADTIAVDIADRFEPALPFEARVAGFLTRLDAPKERLEGFVQAAQGLLDRRVVEPGCILVKGAQLLELLGLVTIVETDPALLPRFAALLQGRIVKLAMDRS